MVKYAHLLVLSVLIFWIAGSGCIGSNSSKMGDEGVTQNVDEAGNTDDLDIALNPAEIQELDTDIAELEEILENVSLQEEIEIEEI